MSRLKRSTGETRIDVEVRKAATGESPIRDIETGEPFLDHMLITLARMAGLDLRLRAEGDLRHHLIEDVAIALGAAIRDEVPDTARRYGAALIPMDDALVQVAIDVGGRIYYEGRLPSRLYEHFLRSFATELGATLHVRVHRGRDRHHVVEAAIKALGLALAEALADGGTVFSTKGSVHWERPEPDAG